MKGKQGCIKGNTYNITYRSTVKENSNHVTFLRGLTMAGKENFTSVKINIKPAVIFQHVCICHNMLGLTHLVKIVCEIIFKKRSLIQNYNLWNAAKQLDELHLPKQEIKLTQELHALYFKDTGEPKLFWWFIDTPTHQTSPNLPADTLWRAVKDLQ